MVGKGEGLGGRTKYYWRDRVRDQRLHLSSSSHDVLFCCPHRFGMTTEPRVLLESLNPVVMEAVAWSGAVVGECLIQVPEVTYQLSNKKHTCKIWWRHRTKMDVSPMAFIRPASARTAYLVATARLTIKLTHLLRVIVSKKTGKCLALLKSRNCWNTYSPDRCPGEKST